MDEKLTRVKAELREILNRYSKNPAAEDGDADCHGPAALAMTEDGGMTAEREARILEAAILRWGSAKQTDVAIEEMAELTKALLKHRRDPDEFRLADIREEMADVSIMLRQLELIYGVYAEEEIAKLERLERMVQE